MVILVFWKRLVVGQHMANSLNDCDVNVTRFNSNHGSVIRQDWINRVPSDRSLERWEPSPSSSTHTSASSSPYGFIIDPGSPLISTV